MGQPRAVDLQPAGRRSRCGERPAAPHLPAAPDDRGGGPAAVLAWHLRLPQCAADPVAGLALALVDPAVFLFCRRLAGLGVLAAGSGIRPVRAAAALPLR